MFVLDFRGPGQLALSVLDFRSPGQLALSVLDFCAPGQLTHSLYLALRALVETFRSTGARSSSQVLS